MRRRDDPTSGAWSDRAAALDTVWPAMRVSPENRSGPMPRQTEPRWARRGAADATEDQGLRMDLRKQCPEVYDQGQLGSCTANAIGGALEFDQMKQKQRRPFAPSRLFIYYNEREIEGTVDADSGAQIRDGVKSVATQGACKETTWPYEIDKFRDQP